MYDPTIGRWISEDPIGFEGGDPNLYRYVSNSPTNYTDPDGLQKQGLFGLPPAFSYAPGWRDDLIPRANDLVRPTDLPKKDIERARDWWYREGVIKRLYNRGFRHGGDFLFHSLQDRPHNLRFDVGSGLSNDIKKDRDFLRMVKTKILDNHPTNEGVGFTKGAFKPETNRDLFYAIGRYKVDYSFRNCDLEIGLTDAYDFDARFRDLFNPKGWKVVLAGETQGHGIIQNYHVLAKINFSQAETERIRKMNFAPAGSDDEGYGY